ncbi:hypothetical protein NLI96_g7531 [Meripilus lineatus]|uniref:Peptidase A1 domain-containing protein n=1 Tax=Meripilus lineatus TaxID=2056292 RepID=A0AAD5V163_9APHY|nr:hypothetical protein NLI96_g7531 [Physisporinus lineatus]
MPSQAMSLVPILYFIVFLPPSTGESWISLNVSVPPWLHDDSEIDQMTYNYNYVDVLIGTPPQKISLSIDTQTEITAVYSQDRCLFCPGTRSFDEHVSSTYNDTGLPFDSTALAGGSWARDTISLDGNLENKVSDFVLIDRITTNTTARGLWPYNGQLALVQEALRSYNHTPLFADLFRSGKLTDPVIGMRLDPMNPRLTAGVIDPNDYEGTLNWVEIEPDNKEYTQYHVFKFDGFQGRNGSYPNSRMLAAIDSKSINIATPNNHTYLSSPNFIETIHRHVDFGGPDDAPTAPCGQDALFIYMSIAINGVSYEIDSKDLIRKRSVDRLCNVGITTNTLLPREPHTILGLPFLRSVYLAYRFPTDSCPGYFGFAFPRGANRTHEQKAQKPTSTPTLSSQCLTFTTPTSTPSPLDPSPIGDGKRYPVYGEESLQVPLIGVEHLVKGIWNVTDGII